jgi:pantoate kinase
MPGRPIRPARGLLRSLASRMSRSFASATGFDASRVSDIVEPVSMNGHPSSAQKAPGQTGLVIMGEFRATSP